MLIRTSSVAAVEYTFTAAAAASIRRVAYSAAAVRTSANNGRVSS